MESTNRKLRSGMRRLARCGAGLLLALAGPAAAFEDAEVTAIVGHEVSASDYAGAGGVWMARQRSFAADGVGNTVVTEHLLARVFDPDWGRERFSPFQRIYWNEFTSLRINRARVWTSRTEAVPLPAEAIRDDVSPATAGVAAYQPLRVASAEFPRLRENDVVEIFVTYTIRVAPWERNTRWCEETFGAEDPVIEQQLVWHAPAAAQIDTGVVGRPLRGTTRHGDGFRTYTWLTGNLPPNQGRLEESLWARFASPGGPSEPNITRAVVAMHGDWSWAGSFFGELWEEAWSSRSGELDRIVSEVSARHPDAAERARALAVWVREEVRSLPIRDADLTVRPLRAAQVLSARAAGSRDKTCLLVSMLRSAGIQADPVLVRERPDTLLARVASLAQLDRFIARARLADGSELWLDPLKSPTALPPGRALLLVGTKDPWEVRRTAGLIDFPGVEARP